MKHLLLIATLTLFLSSLKANAQSGFSTGRYYSQQYAISDVPVGNPYYRYNIYNQIIGVFQQWKYAQWNSSSGGHYVYVWGPYGWQYVWYAGAYYWFNWVVYEKQIN